MQRVTCSDTWDADLSCRLMGLNSRESSWAWMMDDMLFGVSAFCICRVKFLSVCAQPIQNLELIEIYCKIKTRKIMSASDISESSSSFLHIYFSYDYSCYKHCKNCGLDWQVVFMMVFDILGHLKIILWNQVTQPFAKLILFGWYFNPFDRIELKLFLETSCIFWF